MNLASEASQKFSVYISLCAVLVIYYPLGFFTPDMMGPFLLSLILNGNNSSTRNQPNVFMIIVLI